MRCAGALAYDLLSLACPRRDPLHDLGVRLGADGGGSCASGREHATRSSSWSSTTRDLDWITDTHPARARRRRRLERITTRAARPAPATRSASTARTGPATRSTRRTPCSSPTRAASCSADGYDEDWRSVVVDDGFDWGGVAKPRVPLDRTVIYEAHSRASRSGIRASPAAARHLRGPRPPRHRSSTSPRRHDHRAAARSTRSRPSRGSAAGPRNYWGYNTLNFFTPHAAYATGGRAARGPEAVLREFKGMVKLLHEAGLEVILDVVYNHTAEEGIGGPRTSLRGIDNAAYYRQDATARTSTSPDAATRLDTATRSPRGSCWTRCATGRTTCRSTGSGSTSRRRSAAMPRTTSRPSIRCCARSSTTRRSRASKMIAEPWDVGMGGWQTGNFGDGWHEWNDRYRDRVRNFWLSDIDYARATSDRRRSASAASPRAWPARRTRSASSAGRSPA